MGTSALIVCVWGGGGEGVQPYLPYTLSPTPPLTTPMSNLLSPTLVPATIVQPSSPEPKLPTRAEYIDTSTKTNWFMQVIEVAAILKFLL